jgi:hypothetical protein
MSPRQHERNGRKHLRSRGTVGPGVRWIVLFCFLFVSESAWAASLEGHWEGTNQVPGQAL